MTSERVANSSPVIDGDVLYVLTSNGIDHNMDARKEKLRKMPAPHAPNVIAHDIGVVDINSVALENLAAQIRRVRKDPEIGANVFPDPGQAQFATRRLLRGENSDAAISAEKGNGSLIRWNDNHDDSSR